jgi:hypothetical protein
LHLGATRFNDIDDDKTNDTRCRTCGSFLFSVVRDGSFVHVAMGTLMADPTIRPLSCNFGNNLAALGPPF